MEISVDLDFVRRVLEQESQLAREQIRGMGVLAAYGQSQRRHDERINSAPDVTSLACSAGCSWCCYFSVDVRPVEVFRILDFIETEFSDEQKARVYSEIRAYAAELEGLDEMARMRRNVRCVFLDASGRCGIYPVRPQTCRNYHATCAVGCRQSYEQPDNLEIDPEFAPYVYQAGAAHVDGFSRAMCEAGYDNLAYELNAALAEALSDAGARERFMSKGRPFPGLVGREVPEEFDDLEDD